MSANIVNIGTDLVKWITEDLARSGLLPEDFDLTADKAKPAILPVTTTAAYEDNQITVEGYSIQYPTENHSGWIDNFTVHRYRNHPERKYHGSKGRTFPYWATTFHEWLTADIKWIIEGEKKSLAMRRYTGVPTIGIRGCWGWSRGKSVMDEIISGIKPNDKVIMVFDGDIATKHEIRQAAGTLARIIKAHGATPVLPLLPPPPGGVKRLGTDDWIMLFPEEQRTPAILLGEMQKLPLLDWRELPEAPSAMIKRLNLMTDNSNPPKVYRNDENTRTILMDTFGPNAFFTDQYKGPMFQNLKGEAIPYSDETLDSEIFRYLERSFGTWSKESFRAVRRALIAQTPRNLLGEHIASIVWDGVPRVETLLISHFGAVDTPYARKISKGQCLGSIARCIEPGVKWDHILILEGKQRTGKSHGLELLYYDHYVAVNMSLASDQLARKVTSAWCANCDELDHLHKAGREAFKAWSTERIENWVPKYVEYTKTTPRPCVITGTTNNHAYLDDPTGAQRFWPIKVGVTKKVDHAAIIRDRDQIWAEAYHIYRNAPDTWWREFENDMTGAQEEQDMRGAEDPLADIVEAALATNTLPIDDEGNRFVTHHWLLMLAHNAPIPQAKKGLPAIADAAARMHLRRVQIYSNKIDTASLDLPCRAGSDRKIIDEHFSDRYIAPRIRVYYLPKGDSK